MDFFEQYYNLTDLQKRELRNKIILECKIQYPTFNGWIRRKSIQIWHQHRIAELMQQDIDVLFPKSE